VTKYAPSSPVTVCRYTPVAWLVIVSVAPEMAAPCGSSAPPAQLRRVFLSGGHAGEYGKDAAIPRHSRNVSRI
jgi:hypothetical protein